MCQALRLLPVQQQLGWGKGCIFAMLAVLLVGALWAAPEQASILALQSVCCCREEDAKMVPAPCQNPNGLLLQAVRMVLHQVEGDNHHCLGLQVHQSVEYNCNGVEHSCTDTSCR